jgi:hypothetical protein
MSLDTRYHLPGEAKIVPLEYELKRRIPSVPELDKKAGHPAPPTVPGPTNFLLSPPSPFSPTADWERWCESMSQKASEMPGEPCFRLHAQWAADVLIWRADQPVWRDRDPWVVGRA